MNKFRLGVHWKLFTRVQLTIFQHWFRQWLAAGQATIHYLNQWWLVYWRKCASFGLHELAMSDLHFAFIICWSGVHVSRFCHWQKHDHINIAMEMVSIHDITHAWCCLGFRSIYIKVVKFVLLLVTRTQLLFKLWWNLLHTFRYYWNAGRLMEGWTYGAHGSHTLCLRAKMEFCRQIQYCIITQEWIALEIDTTFRNR